MYRRCWSLRSCSFPPSHRPVPAKHAGKVREGISSYRAGDYKQAAEVFSEAESAQPDDLRIAFDRGTALAAQGDDKAVELLQKAALSPDLQLAVRARYNLGCLAAAKARKRFGEHPEKASPEDRKSGLADLAVAIGHFRDCLRMDKDHADARHNLELLRVWIKYMESLWEQTDRQKQRDEMDLAAYLQMLEEKQRGLRGRRPGVGRGRQLAQNSRGPAGGRNGPAKAGRRDPAAEGEDRSHAEQGGPTVAWRDGRRGSPTPAVSAGRTEKGRRQPAIDGGRGRTWRSKPRRENSMPANRPRPSSRKPMWLRSSIRCIAAWHRIRAWWAGPWRSSKDWWMQSSLSAASPGDATPKKTAVAEKATATGVRTKESKKGEATKPSSPCTAPNVRQECKISGAAFHFGEERARRRPGIKSS